MYLDWGGPQNRNFQDRAGRKTEPRQRTVGRAHIYEAGLFPLPACCDPLSGVKFNTRGEKNLVCTRARFCIMQTLFPTDRMGAHSYCRNMLDSRATVLCPPEVALCGSAGNGKGFAVPDT